MTSPVWCRYVLNQFQSIADIFPGRKRIAHKEDVFSSAILLFVIHFEPITPSHSNYKIKDCSKVLRNSGFQ